MTTLEHYAEINPPQGGFDRTSRDLAAFVPMAAVSEDGRLVEPELRPISEVAKGYTCFEQGDVLMAKITPCMENGKAAYLRELPTKQGFGSTEFHVLRPRPGVDPRFVFYLVWNPSFRSEAAKHMTGSAGQKRVPAAFLRRARVPLVEPSEQRRIADILDKADAIRRKRKQAIALTEDLLRSAFLDMFGDPVTNPKGWPVKPLAKLGELDRGRSRHRPRNEPALLGGEHPLIQTGEIANCDGVITSYEQTYSDIGLAQSKMWPAGTLCITIAANIAKTGVLAFDACFPDSVVGFTPGEDATTEYVQYWLSFLQPVLERQAPQSAQKNINLEILRTLNVPAPDVDLQRRFSTVVARIRRGRSNMRLALDGSENLFHSLVASAFAGSRNVAC